MAKKQMNIIILVGILVLITTTSGCTDERADMLDPTYDPWEEGDIDTSGGVEEYETQDQSSYNSDICPECKGAGIVKCYNYKRDVESCDGTGKVVEYDEGRGGLTCRICGGTGQITCPKCDGTGKI